MATERFQQRIGELLGDAREAARQSDWRTVGALAESVLALDPANGAAVDLLEESHRRTGGGGEWRHLTVMFSDIVGSTRLTEEHDPEVVRDRLREYQTVVNAVVERYEGHVARYIGDGVLAYFGYPSPHEDDARRAVKAGLELLDSLAAVGATAREGRGLELSVRVAVHTGMVIRADMGPPGSPDRDAVVGETPNVAARLQDAAQPGTLVVSGDTYRLVRGYFEVEPLGALTLRGISRSVRAFEVVREAQATGRLEVQRELSPFVNRHRELERLSALWRKTVNGSSQVAVIRGEPGIGKSRLMEALRSRVIVEHGTTLPFRCSTFHATNHLYPARRLVAEVCGIDLAGGLAEAPLRLRAGLSAVGLEDRLPLFGALLGVPPGPECPPPELDGQRLREATLTALVDWIEREAARSARALVIDDVQWADPSTIELIDRIIARKPPRILVLLSCRTGFEPQWTSVEVLELGPLASSDLAGIAATSPTSERLATAQVEELVRRSDGVPLYFEELLRLEDQPSDQPAPRLARSHTAIPTALLDPLLSRLAAPGVELGLIQTVACIGEEVRYDLLAEIVELPDRELRAKLEQLVDAGLIDRDDGDPPTYRFHHHLLRELAYETQLTPARVQRHSRIADAIQGRTVGDGSTDAGLLAQHLEQGGRTEEAIEAFVAAARDAQVKAAFAEADELLDHALELVAGVDDQHARLTLELAVRRARGFSMVATQGYGAPAAADEHERCLAICSILEPGPEHLPDLIAIWSYYMSVGALARAEEVMSVDRRRIGEGGPDEPPDELWAGWSGYYGRGDLEATVGDLRSYLESDYAQREEVWARWPLPNDPTVASWALLSPAEYIRGDPVAARAAIDNAEARAAKLAFPWGPFSMAWAKAYRCTLERLAGDEEAVEEAIAAMLELGERHGFTYWTIFGQLHHAVAMLRHHISSDREPIMEALEMWRVVGGDLMMPWHLTEFGEAQLASGELDGAEESLREAAAISERTGERYWAAETARILGEVRIAAGDAAGAEHLREAAEIASHQGARVFELRARTALCETAESREEVAALAKLVDTFGDRPGPPELAAARQVLAERQA